MRVKSIGGRARAPNMALPKLLSIPRSVSLLTREDCDGDGSNYSSETERIETQSDGVHEHVTPHSGGERCFADAQKAPSGDIFGGDVMEIDSLEETCIKCNGGGEVLFCCETGCPVALHEKCVGNKPIFDDTGKFYCPYCLYKRALARTRELREKVMEAKKELSSFLDPKVVGGDKGEGKETNANRPDMSELHGNINYLGHENISDNDINENQFGQGMEPRRSEGEENIDNLDENGGVDDHQKLPSPHASHDSGNLCHGQEETIRGIEPLRDNLEREERYEDETFSTHQFEVREVGEGVRADDSREHEDGLHERVVEDKQQAEPSNACYINEETNVDGSLNTSTTQAHDNANVSEEISCRNKEQMQPQVQENFVSSTRVEPERRAKQRTKNTGQPHNVDSPSKFTKLATHLKDASKGNGWSNKESPITSKASRDVYYGGKRKRLLWTAEEEEMIKKGVKIISSNINKNIPWRKILDFGRHVFHPSRQPYDLKDKWKTLSKESK